MSKYEFSQLADHRKAARKRLGDAVTLLGEEGGDWGKRKGAHARGAMYMAGYAVECKLKAIAMEVNRCRSLSELQAKWGVTENEVYTHGLEAIAQRLPLYKRFTRSPAWRAFTGQVNRWRVAWRYDGQDERNDVAAAFVQAVKEVLNWLESNR
jgi:hypothetical protein